MKRPIYSLLIACALAVAFFVGLSYISNQEASLEKQICDKEWTENYIDSSAETIVFYKDGTGRRDENFFNWEIIDNDKLRITTNEWSETYSATIVGEGTTQGIDYTTVSLRELHLLDTYGEEVILYSWK